MDENPAQTHVVIGPEVVGNIEADAGDDVIDRCCGGCDHSISAFECPRAHPNAEIDVESARISDAGAR